MSDSATPATGAETQGNDKPIMIPKARFDEVNNAKKSLEDKLATITAKEELARQEQLKAAGQFGELETEYKQKLTAAEERAAALEAKATEYEKQQTAAREAQIAALPETHRGFASTLTPEQLSAYMVQHGGVKGPEIRPGAPGVPVNTGKATPEEIVANIANPKWRAENAHRIY